MKFIFWVNILLIYVFFCPNLDGQGNSERKIQGLVIDSLTNAGMPNASVIFFQNEKQVGGVKTGADGSFIFLLKGELKSILKIQYVGYKTKEIVIEYEVKTLVMSPVKMIFDQIALAEVKVIGKKPFIEQSLGKLTLNVAESITGVGGAALDILKKAPFVTVDADGNVALKGKTGVQIQVDGKLTNLSGDNLSKLLENLPSGSIDKIDIITNPSAKYEAEGRASGVINIKTIKGKGYGTNGSVTLGVGIGEKYRYNTGIDLNNRTEKINIFGSFNRTDFQQYNRIYSNSLRNQILFQENIDMETHRFNNSLKLGLDYQIDRKNTIGFLVNGFINQSEATRFTTTDFSKSLNAPTDSAQTTMIDKKTNWDNTALNLNYVRKIDSTGKILKMDIDYLKNTSLFEDNFTIRNINRFSSSILPRFFRYNVPLNMNIASFTIDYENPLSDGRKLEIGIKSRISWLTNDAKFDVLSENKWLPDSKRTNYYQYQENVNAGYVNYSTKVKPWGLNLSMGLRAEHTSLEGFSVTNNERFNRNYLQFFPNITVQKELSANSQLGITYSRSITRPKYEQFNPFVFYTTDYTTTKGNPILNPTISYTTSVDYSYKNTFFISLAYLETTDVVSLIPRLNTERREMAYVYENFGKNYDYYLDFIYNGNITAWWQTNSELALYYQKVETMYDGEIYTNQKPYFGFVYSNTFLLGKGYNAELSGSYRDASVLNVFTFSPTYNVDIGVSKSIFSKKGMLKLNVSDVFNQLLFKSNANYANIDLYINRKVESRYFRLNFSYRFGNNSVKKSRNRQTGLGSEGGRLSN